MWAALLSSSLLGVACSALPLWASEPALAQMQPAGPDRVIGGGSQPQPVADVIRGAASLPALGFRPRTSAPPTVPGAWLVLSALVAQLRLQHAQLAEAFAARRAQPSAARHGRPLARSNCSDPDADNSERC
jgi:hypothetical protein